MKLHILTNALDVGDAVSTHCILLKERAKEIGIPAFLYAEFSHPSVSRHVTPLEELANLASADDILLHQLFNESALMSYVEQFPGIRVLMYHNITPPEYFQPGSDTYQSCSRGLRLVRSLPPLYDLALGMSEFSRLNLEEMGYRNTGVFPLMTNVSHLRSNLRRDAGNTLDSRVNFLFVGRIAPNKRIDNLLRFASQYRSLGRPVTLTLVGNDNQHPAYKEQLLGLAGTLGLSVGDEVLFRGKISDQARDQCYQDADAFVCLSEHEGYCAPLIESMVAGLPTFTLDAAACAETMGGAGVLFSSPAPTVMVETVRDVLEDPARLEEVIAAQRRRVAELTPKRQQESLTKMIESALSAVRERLPLPSVSVVINTYNRGWYLERCLESLRAQTYSDFEVVVVNGPSSDDTEARLHPWEGKIRLVRTDSRVLSVARNVGIANSRGDLVAFLDDDAVADPGWLAEIVPAFQDPKVGGVGGLVHRMNGRDIEFRNGILNREGAVRWNEPLPGLHWHWEEGYLNTVSGNNCMFRGSALRQIGGFDEHIEYYHDEADVVMRLEQAGFRTLHRPRAVVYHEAARSQNRKSIHDLNWYAIVKNTLYVALKNYKGAQSKASLARAIARQIVRQRMQPMFAWRRSGDIGFSQLCRMELACLRGIAVGVHRGWRMTPALARFSDREEPILRFPKQSAPGLRVCLLTQSLPEESPGGIATYTMTLAQALRDLGVTVHVISRGDSNSEPEFRDGIWHHFASSFPLKRLDLPPDLPTVAKNLEYANGVRKKVEEIAATQGLDLVESPSWDAEGLLLAMEPSVPIVVRWHSPLFKVMETQTWFATPDLKMCCELERLLGKYAQAVSGSTVGILEAIESRYELDRERTALIPLGLDVPPDAEQPRSSNNTGGVRVLFVGRLERRKGIHVLLAALPDVLRKLPQVTVDIVGRDDSSGGASWAERWASLHPDLARKVRFHGERASNDLSGFYRGCDLFVAPSLYESFGLVYLEAMVCGKAVIGTRVGGIPDVVANEETGILVPPESVADLTAALLRLLEDPQLRDRFGRAGAARFRENFSKQALGERTLRFYQDVVKQWHRTNPPVWRGSPLDAFRHPSARITWSPTAQSLLVAAEPGEPSTLWYGPYISLAPGWYHAEFMLMTVEPFATDAVVATVDVVNLAAGLRAEEQIRGAEFSRSATIATLCFHVPDNVTGTYEFRVHSSGAACLSVREIVVRRWPLEAPRAATGRPEWSWARQSEHSTLEASS
jgi:glycosyltransferase involved in cell wall biosynthesis/GT2 family glycosyltransferase